MQANDILHRHNIACRVDDLGREVVYIAKTIAAQIQLIRADASTKVT